MSGKVTYKFRSKMYQHQEPTGWFFVSLPKEISKEIRTHFKNLEEGWGRMKVVAIVNEIKWKTSIWYATKEEMYLLPIKADIRKKGNILPNITLDISVLL